MTRISGNSSGIAGEYFVAAELARRGLTATITMKNSRSFDILATNHDASRVVSIQVKTKQGNKEKWLLSKKSEKLRSRNFFYVFVLIPDKIDESPRYYIVPSAKVANSIDKNHKQWIKGRKSNGEKRKDTDLRAFRDSDNKYFNKWNLLKLG